MRMQPVWSCKRCQNLLKVWSSGLWSFLQLSTPVRPGYWTNWCFPTTCVNKIWKIRYTYCVTNEEVFKKTETRVIQNIETRRMRWALLQVVYSDAITKWSPTSQLHGFLVEEKELKSAYQNTHVVNYPDRPCSSRRRPKEPNREGLPPKVLNSLGGTEPK